MERSRNSTNVVQGMDKVEDWMESREKQGNVIKNGNSFEEKAVDRKESGIPIYPPTMITMRVPSDMMDRETIVAFNPNPESSTTNDGQQRNDMDWLGTIWKRTHNEPERGVGDHRNSIIRRNRYQRHRIEWTNYTDREV